MRDALAFSDNDIAAPREPRAPKPKRSAKRAEQPQPVRKPMFRFKLRPRVALFLGFIGLVGVGVPLNALYLQDGRHPAPLFKSTLTLPKQVAHAAPPPAPPHRPAPASEPARAETIKTEVRPTRTETAKAEPAHAEKAQRDEIGMLLEGAAPKAETADKSVLFAQRALAKLGYALRADGVFGGSTRQALEKFERDSGLPVKGELTPKILRQLAARSGLPRD